MGIKGILSGLTDPSEAMICYENDDLGGGGGAGDGDPNAGDGKDPGWLAGLPQDMREQYGEELKGYAKVGDFVKSHYDGAAKYANAVFMPGENATPEEVAAYQEKMGIPKDVSGYELGNPENLPEGMKVDDQMKSWFAERAHKLGLTSAQAKELYGEFNNLQVNRFNAASDQYNAQKTKVERELRTKYGDAMEAKLEEGKRVYEKLFDETARTDLDRMGLGGNLFFLNAMIQLSEKVSEDSFFDGSSAGGGALKGDGGLYYENTPGMRVEDQ